MAENDIFWLSGQDSDMQRAIAAAQATFAEFARQIDMEHFRIVPAFDTPLVKAFFPHPDDPTRGEHMFVTEISLDGQTVHGILASEPNDIPGLSDGDDVSFPISRVSDWFLVDGEYGFGGFTIDVMKKQMPPKQWKAFRDQPPLSWYRHRKTSDAISDQARLPVCESCGERDLFGEQQPVNPCGLCRNELKRCSCPSCGAPIIRPPDAPRECYNCISSKDDSTS